MNPAATARVLLWDYPARICHWGFATTSTAALFLGLRFPPSSTAFKYHIICGLFSGWFLAVRVVLGVFGSKPLRLSGLLFTPGSVLRYLLGVVQWRQTMHFGLNPGSAAFAAGFYLLLAALIWSGFVPDWVERWHGPLAYAVLWLIGAHLVGLFLHAVRHREMTPLAMVHGRVASDSNTGLASARPLSGLLVFLLSLAVGGYLFWTFDVPGASVRFPWFGEVLLPITEKG